MSSGIENENEKNNLVKILNELHWKPLKRPSFGRSNEVVILIT